MITLSLSHHTNHGLPTLSPTSSPMLSKTVLLCNAVSVLYLRFGRARSMRRNRAEDSFCIAKLQANNAPWNFRLVVVRENYETRCEFGYEIMYGPISLPWLETVLREERRRLESGR